MRNAYRYLIGKFEAKRQLGRPKRRWEDNINMDLKQKVNVPSGTNWLRLGFSDGLL
jgi:hypothetical protein